MTVYHGTTIERAKNIFRCKQIFRTNDDIKRFPKSDNGYVYVTDNFVVALEFATRNLKIDSKEIGVVFKIEIDECQLILDKDENENSSFYDSSVNYTGYKINKDLVLGEDVIKVLFKEVSYTNYDDYLNKLSRGFIQISEKEWEDLTKE